MNRQPLMPFSTPPRVEPCPLTGAPSLRLTRVILNPGDYRVGLRFPIHVRPQDVHGVHDYRDRVLDGATLTWPAAFGDVYICESPAAVRQGLAAIAASTGYQPPVPVIHDPKSGAALLLLTSKEGARLVVSASSIVRVEGYADWMYREGDRYSRVTYKPPGGGSLSVTVEVRETSREINATLAMSVDQGGEE